MLETTNYSDYSGYMINTLAISRKLQAAGFPQIQGEAQAEVLCEIAANQNVATKTDLEIMHSNINNRFDIVNNRLDAVYVELNNKIDSVNSRIDSTADKLRIEISQAKNQLIVLFVSMIVGQTMAVMGLIKFIM